MGASDGSATSPEYIESHQVIQKQILVLFYDYLYKAKELHERPALLDV
jgi:hypothetical protein